MRIKPELISFETTDHLELPGLLYEPQQKTKKVVIFLHGNGSASIFYKSKKMNLFAAELAKNGWAFLPFNNRGAHYIKKFSWKESGEKKEGYFGTALEKIEDAVFDIEAAIEFAQTRGYEEIVLVGESSGANKIVVYNFLHPQNACLGYALIGGGDDTGLFYQHYGKEKFWTLLQEARQRVQQGLDQVFPEQEINHNLFAYRALADIMNPDGLYNCFPFYEYFSGERLGQKEFFKEFKQIAKPTLVLYGAEDVFCYKPAAEVVPTLLGIHPQPSMLTGVVAEGADHSFSGTEELEAQHLCNWLKKITA